MDFWDNLLRYPRFFLSSMLGLALVLTSPLIRISKEIQNKRLLLSLFLISALILVWILVLMTNPPD
jgi:Protein of unknown function (DUF751)